MRYDKKDDFKKYTTISSYSERRLTNVDVVTIT
jgi:hypothetical protein